PGEDDLRELPAVGLAEIAAVADVLVEPHDGNVELADSFVTRDASLICNVTGAAFDEQHGRLDEIVELVVDAGHAAARDAPGRDARIADGADGHEPAARKAVRRNFRRVETLVVLALRI